MNEDGWRVLQRRVDDTVSFDRDWNDYVNGFGSSSTNFWIGLAKMHQLTLTPVPLRINIELFDSEKFSLNYTSFAVGDESTNFTIYVAGYEYTEHVNVLTNGIAFSTKDRDNDLDDTYNFAVDPHLGGWWYSRYIDFLNLNGRYDGNITPTTSSMYMLYIGTISGFISATKPIKTVEMTIDIA